MNATSSPLSTRLAGVAPLVVRVIVGVIMFAHGLMKVQRGPAMFGEGLAEMGVPAAAFSWGAAPRPAD